MLNSPKSKRTLKQKLHLRWQQWLSRRLPANEQVTLNHRSIFILPTRFGMTWLVLIIILFLLGTNYQNNLIMGLSFLLLSIFNTCIIYSYKNLAGLTLTSTKANHCFANQPIYFPIRLCSKSKAYELQLNFPNQPLEVIKTVAEQPVQGLITFSHSHRGINRPGRLKVESHYPLGLCKAWSHVDLAIEQLVFAQPIADPKPIKLATSQHDEQHDSGKYVSGVDEYKGLRDYQVGEPLKQVAWKQWAQGRGMLSKEFEQPQGAPMWLSLDKNTFDPELAISHLAWHTEQLSEKKQMFGAILAGNTIAPSHGEQHRISMQTQLALLPQFNKAKSSHD
ncbi:DUF58 domain-containing protein [Shewanella sairae]|uniref:DUF58 domain-containing protein n=1 Tax=Shewanella sairae TaxID=190310 RepID=A0ABQ4PDH3_9GAMM|nr:DUF58 domain-containing protein [Shewanella sairae]MCL1129030.1 DUF58 domain-containing protein [Shewanella sairae]GIU45176.1 DUF58 domain-containing protein [Shewanella sairae]